MSMHAALFGDDPIPEDTRRVAERTFPKGSPYMQLRDHFGMLYHNQQFAHLFAREGQPALAPARLALVSVMQFMEGLTDRQAADAVRSRIDWKYALGLALDDPGFHYSVLSEFRARLLPDQAETLLFETLLDHLSTAKLLKARGTQRTDSTHVLAHIRMLERIERIGETMRAALNALAEAYPAWLLAHAEDAWRERYAHRFEHYRLPKPDAERQAVGFTIAQDGFQLLTLLSNSAAPAAARQLPEVLILWRVWITQWYTSTIPTEEVLRWRTTAEQPPFSQQIHSPYDPDARYATKRETHWVGYRVHLTETCDADTPSVITDVTTTPSTTNDWEVTTQIQERLVAREVPPATHLLDTGYVDATILVESARDRAIQVIGPVLPDASWQARTPGALVMSQFVIDWEAHRATCPAGQQSSTWETFRGADGEPATRIGWALATCMACPLQARCTKGTKHGRRIRVYGQEAYEALQAARAAQKTDGFKAIYKRRAGIEGTMSQGDRRCDLRHARYIGLAKTHLQHVLIAIALTLIRVVAWWADTPRARTRTSAFTRLMAKREPALA